MLLSYVVGYLIFILFRCILDREIFKKSVKYYIGRIEKNHLKSSFLCFNVKTMKLQIIPNCSVIFRLSPPLKGYPPAGINKSDAAECLLPAD